jgi:hypothetical protein
MAVQQHGGAEGLVAHQIAHLLFIVGIGYLLSKIIRSRFNDPGWFEFKVFLWLIIGWNILTFTGHWMRESVDPAGFSRIYGRVVSYSVNDIFDAYFYLTRLDHLLLVPSFIFLFLALRKWGDQS